MTSEIFLSCPKYRRTPLGRYGVNELTNGLEVLLDAFHFGSIVSAHLCPERTIPGRRWNYKGSGDQAECAPAVHEAGRRKGSPCPLLRRQQEVMGDLHRGMEKLFQPSCFAARQVRSCGRLFGPLTLPRFLGRPRLPECNPSRLRFLL